MAHQGGGSDGAKDYIPGLQPEVLVKIDLRATPIFIKSPITSKYNNFCFFLDGQFWTEIIDMCIGLGVNWDPGRTLVLLWRTDPGWQSVGRQELDSEGWARSEQAGWVKEIARRWRAAAVNLESAPVGWSFPRFPTKSPK